MINAPLILLGRKFWEPIGYQAGRLRWYPKANDRITRGFHLTSCQEMGPLARQGKAENYTKHNGSLTWLKKIGLKYVPRRFVQEGRPKVSSFQSQRNPQPRLILDSSLVWVTASKFAHTHNQTSISWLSKITLRIKLDWKYKPEIETKIKELQTTIIST